MRDRKGQYFSSQRRQEYCLFRLLITPLLSWAEPQTICGFLFHTETLGMEKVIQKFISWKSSSAHTVHILLQEIGEDPTGIRNSSITNTYVTLGCGKFRLYLLQDKEYWCISEHEIWSLGEPSLKKQFMFKYSLARFHPNQSIWSFPKLNPIMRG